VATDHGKTELRTSVSRIQSESWTPVVEKGKVITPLQGTLNEFADTVYDQLDALGAARGGGLRFTREEHFGYMYTALCVRVEHVSKGRWLQLGHTRNYDYGVHEGWAVLPPLEYVLASVGNASYGPAAIQVYPDLSAPTPVLEKRERDRITAEIRGICSANAVRYSTVLPKDYDGHKDVMLLTYVDNTTSESVTYDTLTAMWLAPTGQCTVEDAIIASIIGLRDPEVVPGMGVPSMWFPQVHVKDTTVRRYLVEFSRLAI